MAQGKVVYNLKQFEQQPVYRHHNVGSFRVYVLQMVNIPRTKQPAIHRHNKRHHHRRVGGNVYVRRFSTHQAQESPEHEEHSLSNLLDHAAGRGGVRLTGANLHPLAAPFAGQQSRKVTVSLRNHTNGMVLGRLFGKLQKPLTNYLALRPKTPINNRQIRLLTRHRGYASLELLPNRLHHIIPITVDYPHHLLSHIRHAVVCHQSHGALITPALVFQNGQALQHTFGAQAYHHGGGFFHAFGAFVGFADVQGREVEDGGFFVDGAAVRQHRLGAQLQLVVILEAQRFQQAHVVVELHAHGIHPLLGAGVGGYDHRVAVLLGHRVQGVDQGQEVSVGIHILFPVGAHHKELAFFQSQAIQHVRRLNALTEVVQHFKHGAAGFDHPVRRQAFAQQVIPGDGAVGQVDVCRVVHNTPVDLFRYPHIKATVAGFHVEGGNLAALGGNHRHAAVGIAQYQQGFRLNFCECFVHRDNHVADGFGTARAGGTQEVVRLADAQVLEEDFIQLEIVVLAGVHQNVLAVLIQLGHHPGQTNNLRPGADHGHYFQFFHGSSRFGQASVPTGRSEERRVG